ncbi:MAG: glycosyl hydrolase [Caldilineaceae bacterium]|nr:glycosyl hydrolase [Caldilineaceae bacterium]
MTPVKLDPTLLDAMKFRCIGPPRGGRVVAVAGHPTDPATFYFGACAGGIWKSDDGGMYWKNLSDGQLQSSAVGALAVSEADPNVIYAGMGEATIRGDVSWGDGVYKSTDGGETWRHCGLSDTHHIAKIRIHPRDPDVVYVAALGHAFGPNAERGVFRSQDGGATWEKVLYVSDKAGVADLTLDPNNPRILYAAVYETYRNFWSLSSGGPESGLWKSADGGDTWTDLSANPGLPTGLKGKIGVTAAPQAGRVWAIIEAEGDKSGVYRSDNDGATWQQVSANRDLIQRPWYYCHIFADPQDGDTVYILNLKMWKSTDAGVNWTEVTTPHGDNHDLWIDPANPRRMIEGNDGGACVSFNGGDSWSTVYNQLTAQFYHLDIDNQYPYRVYGTQQDNSSISVPSATEKGAIPWGDAYNPGTGESGYIAVKPDDPNIVFIGAVGSSPGGGGALQRYDHRTRQLRLVTVWPEGYHGHDPAELKYRFAWTFPIVFSPHDPDLLYATGNHVFRTRDQGDSWACISPDLSRNQPETLKASGGPLTLDTSGAETYGTVFAFAESPATAGVLWAGSDDGLVHISRDDGATWTDVTPGDLPDDALVSLIEPAWHDAGTAYLAATRYKLDDYRPYLFKTDDFGQSWQVINGDLPENEISRVIRQDPVQPNLLFAGTETGLYVSLDDGASWQRQQANLPVAPIYDMKIKECDLVIATHGRSFWIADDITPLREYAAGLAANAPQLIAPRLTVRHWNNFYVGVFGGSARKNYMLHLGAGQVTYEEKRDDHGERSRMILDGGENPPEGVIIYYILPDGLSDEARKAVTLTLRNEAGEEIRAFCARPETNTDEGAKKSPKGERTLAAEAGLNRFIWDMRYPDAVTVAGDPTVQDAGIGPRAAPGIYQVELKAGDVTRTQSFELKVDPRLDVSQADMDAQFELWREIRDKVSQVHQGVTRLQDARRQVQEWMTRSKASAGPEAIQSAGRALVDRLNALEARLIQTEAKSAGDRLRLKARVNQKLISLVSVVAAADARPTRQAYAVFAHLAQQADEGLAELDELLTTDMNAFVELIRGAEIPPIVIEGGGNGG